MRKRLGLLIVATAALVWAGCQQTQEADEEPDTTVIKEKETVVTPPAEADADAEVEMDVRTSEGDTTSAEVQVEGEQK